MSHSRARSAGLAERMLKERERADNTDPQKFMAYIVWRRKEFANRTTSCGCSFERSLSMEDVGIVFHVCTQHAEYFGIGEGPCFEDEARTLLRRAEQS
jgi:hypothetical protein